MGKGRAALTYLPPVEIVVTTSGGTHSIEALKAGAEKVAQMQENETPDGTYTAEKCLTNTPYSEAIWDITVAIGNVAGDYQLTFDSEVIAEDDAIGRAALSTRRPITFGLAANTNEFSVRSLLSVINFVEKLEDRVAQTGDTNEGDATYTDIVLRGFTPYESFQWTVTKLADAYTIVSTSGS